MADPIEIAVTARPLAFQYAFLDVVQFTVGRTVEAQVHILETINRLVGEALEHVKVSEQKRILLPTGDGLCVAFLQPEPFDLAVGFALDLLSRVHEYNEGTTEARRQFQIRIGVNQNADSLFTDINGRLNLAGRGINLSQRIMSFADGGQLLVGSPIHELLCERERYVDHLRTFYGSDKHGFGLTVHQLRADDCLGLNTDIPRAFAHKTSKPDPIPEWMAHFVANAFKYRDYLERRSKDIDFEEDAGVILVHLLSHDSAAAMAATLPYRSIVSFVEYDAEQMPDPTYQSIRRSFVWVAHELSRMLVARLEQYAECFSGPSHEPALLFPSDRGLERVRTEQSAVWAFVVGDQPATERPPPIDDSPP